MPFHLSKVFQSHFKEQVDEHVMIGYFPNWAIYQRNYKPCDVPVEKLTHIFYAFANINPEDGSVFLTDLWSDQQIKYDQQGEEQNHLYGNFFQFLQYKKQHRHLKLLLSIGGWSYSSNFRCLDDPQKRSRFAESAVQLLADNGLDGLDVDWEYPETKQQSHIYTQLLRELRSRLDAYHSEVTPNEPRYLLTVAAPAAPQKYEMLDIREMDSFLDFWNLMTYDFSGSWDSNANPQANLYGSPLSVQRSVEYYASHGTKASKLVVGIPLYGRGFNGTKGHGDRYSQVAPGSLEAGVYSYRELPLNNATEHFDKRSGAGFSYDPSQGQLISYDTVESARAKANYIQKKGLLGAMFWELSGDRPCSDPRSLVNLFAGKLAPLDTQPNHLHYPKSKFVNVRSSP
ncbi:chitinase [Malassezia yamatoensis]|uniref:chitinase n=1 Tax=Malassezia yamatoensis TaxID=253288 RepID=A0AAJ5YRP4_9BASI|nr:chitinase [Malassezia yamatoensis]